MSDTVPLPLVRDLLSEYLLATGSHSVHKCGSDCVVVRLRSEIPELAEVK